MGCDKPYLDPNNEYAWRIFGTMCNQPVVGGMGGYIGVDFTLFEPLCNSYGVPESERRILLDKIVLLNKISGSIWRQQEAEHAKQAETERIRKR